MAKIQVVVPITIGALPSSSSAYDHTEVILRDVNGAESIQVLNGRETPAWTATFENVPSGKGDIRVVAYDVDGNPIGQPIAVPFDTLQGTYPVPGAPLVTILEP